MCLTKIDQKTQVPQFDVSLIMALRLDVLAAARRQHALALPKAAPTSTDATLAADLAAALTPLDAETDAVPAPAPPGLAYRRLFIPLSLQDRLTAAVDAAAAGRWLDAPPGRRTANVGGKPGDAAQAEPLPPPLEVVAKALAPAFPGGLTPNHVLVNELAPGGGLPPHSDGELYSSSVVITLLGPSTLDLRPGTDAAAAAAPPAAQLAVRPGDCVLLTGDAYENWTHAVPPVTADTIRPDCANAAAAGVAPGDVVARGERRLSLVFVRKVGTIERKL